MSHAESRVSRYGAASSRPPSKGHHRRLHERVLCSQLPLVSSGRERNPEIALIARRGHRWRDASIRFDKGLAARESSKGRPSFSFRAPSALKTRTSEHSVLAGQKDLRPLRPYGQQRRRVVQLMLTALTGHSSGAEKARCLHRASTSILQSPSRWRRCPVSLLSKRRKREMSDFELFWPGVVCVKRESSSCSI
jgi:hypothetical protein